MRDRQFESGFLQQRVQCEPPRLAEGNQGGARKLPLASTPDVDAPMPNVSVIAAILLGAPLAALAQTSTNPNPGPHSTLGTESTTATGIVTDQIKTKLESLGYTQVPAAMPPTAMCQTRIFPENASAHSTAELTAMFSLRRTHLG